MSQVFPYGIMLQEGGKVALFPAAEVTFPAPDGERVSLFLIIDSGATISALPSSDATIFGVQADRGVPITVAGITGEPLYGWRHEIQVKLGDEEILLPVVLLDSPYAPRVLGREGIFERFMIVFDEARCRSGFIDENTKEGNRIREIVGGI